MGCRCAEWKYNDAGDITSHTTYPKYQNEHDGGYFSRAMLIIIVGQVFIHCWSPFLAKSSDSTMDDALAVCCLSSSDKDCTVLGPTKNDSHRGTHSLLVVDIKSNSVKIIFLVIQSKSIIFAIILRLKCPCKKWSSDALDMTIESMFFCCLVTVYLRNLTRRYRKSAHHVSEVGPSHVTWLLGLHQGNNCVQLTRP